MVGLAFSGSEVDLVIEIIQFLVDGFWSQLFNLVA